MPSFPPDNAIRPGPGGAHVSKNITAATQVKTGRGYVYRIFINTAPSAAGGVYDNTSATAATLITNIPTTAGVLTITAPFYTGLYVDPGTGGVVSVSYD